MLLKNDGNLLPLDISKLKTIAVIGNDASVNPIATGGGSGHVIPPYIVILPTPLHNTTHAGTLSLTLTYYRLPLFKEFKPEWVTWPQLHMRATTVQRLKPLPRLPMLPLYLWEPILRRVRIDPLSSLAVPTMPWSRYSFFSTIPNRLRSHFLF